MTVCGKGRHRRELPLTAAVDRAVLAYLADEPTTCGPLVRSRTTGQPLLPLTISTMVSGWLRDAGVKQRAWDGRGSHSLRHTRATTLADAGADVRVIQALLGHQDLTSTQRYLRRADLARMRAALAAVSPGPL